MSEHKYGCYDHEPREPRPLEWQDGWQDGKRRMVTHVTTWRQVQCGHDFRATDPACSGCRWREGPG